MADCTSQCDKTIKIGSETDATRRSPKYYIDSIYKECNSNINEETTFNDSLCDNDVDMDSESRTTTSLTPREILTINNSWHGTIIDLDLNQKCATSTQCSLKQHLYTDSDTLVETSNKRSSKSVEMKAWRDNNNFDLGSVLITPTSPTAEKLTSNGKLNLSLEANHKVNPLECASGLRESSSGQVISGKEIDFRSNSDDEVYQLGRDQIYFPPQCSHVKMKNDFLNELGIDLRSVISESSSSKPTSENVLGFDSEVVNYKENMLERKPADSRHSRNPSKNSYCYDSDFDLRSSLSESSSSKPNSESVLDFELVVANYKKNLLARKQIDNRHECNLTKKGNQHDTGFDLRSTLSESSSTKPTSEIKHNFEAELNYEENLLQNQQADCRPPRNLIKNGYYYDPDFDLRSTLSESSSPKLTSESKVDSETETSRKVSESKDNRPQCYSRFDLRYVLDAKQSDKTSEECDISQKIITKSKNKVIQIHRDIANFSHSDFFRQRNKKLLKRRQQRRRSLCRKQFLKEVIIDDIFDPAKQELTYADETPSSVTEFLRRMRGESDKRKNSQSVVNPF